MKRPVFVLFIFAAYACGALTVIVIQKYTSTRTAARTQAQPMALTRPASQPATTPALSRSFTNSIGIKFVRIEPGEFLMGSPESEVGHVNEETQHRVKLTKAFSIATTSVTQAQWTAVAGSNPSYGKGDDHPVEQVSWNDAVNFCRKLSAREGRHYRLPTEAEWEYACRAGTTTEYYTGTGESALKEAGWYTGNADGHTHPVAQKKPNDWGLYDMHGNVWNYCSDGFTPFTSADATDPLSDPDSAWHVAKGGGWDNDPQLCRSATRGRIGTDGHLVDVGLRLCLDAP